ncbi:hypothetical protein DPMN_192410 [Dreissena polymorpha]|uniref:G-protein coupled receptors family 1 profile domain-containing protein n=1 Tax=Dreissena polymorpha TaxID=45954 RepID=A0A9D3Y084_DREPO|nr:hypothetical protein DPMN_192410 [Dreissena polymorpha]
MCGIVSGFLIAWIPFFTVVYMSLYANFKHPSLAFLQLSYYLNPLVNPAAFFIFHRLRLQRSQPSVYSGTTVLRSSGESRHVRSSTMLKEIKGNDDKSATSDHGAEEETVFCDSSKIMITNANNESILIDENGIDNEK